MFHNQKVQKKYKSLEGLKNQLKSIPTAEIAEKLGIDLHQTGNSLQGNCPTGHKSKSGTCFSINTKGNYWHCFSCDKSGDNIALVQLATESSFKDAIEWICDHFAIKNNEIFEEPTQEELERKHREKMHDILFQSAYKWMHSKLFDAEGKEVHYYLTHDRSYDHTKLQDSEFCVFPRVKEIQEFLREQHPDLEDYIKTLPVHSAFGDNFDLAFPYRDVLGKITGFVKRSIEPEGATITKGDKEIKNQRYDSTAGLSKKDLFNLCNCDQGCDLVIVEGYPDAVYFHALGMKKIAAVGQGRLSESHLLGLAHKKIKNVIISFDNDEVGPSNTEGAVKLLLEKSDVNPFVLDPLLLAPHKDPDEYVKANGLEAYITLLDKAEKGSLWVVNRLLANYEKANALEKSRCLEEVCKFSLLVKNPLDTEQITSVIQSALNQKKPIVKKLLTDYYENNNPDSSEPEEYGEFWAIGENGLEIIMTDYVEFIIREGFAKYYLDKDYTFIRTENNIVREYSLPQIKDYILSYVGRMEEDEWDTKRHLYETLYSYVGQYFNEGLIECIPPQEIIFKRDGWDNASIYYKNGYVVLKRNSAPEIYPYEKLDSPIWGHLINERSIELIASKNQKAEFEQFLLNVVGGNIDRFTSLCSAIGYLLHDYKQESNTKAIILCDQMISDNPNGRTGKSLIGKAIGKIKNLARVDGKNFEFQEKFTFQMVKLGTQIIDFNDVKADFDFEHLFHVITESMTVEYKNKNPFDIPFSESPKIMLSTNYTIRGEGSSFKDRMFEIEFSDFYNDKHKPKDDFGHEFFNGWDEEEWNRFDNFMLECLQLYLDKGLISCAPINLGQRKLIDQTSAEFVEFAEQNIKLNTDYDLNQLFTDYKSYIGFEADLFNACPIKQNTFTMWLPVYASDKGAKYKKRKSSGKQIVTLSLIQ